MARFFITGDTHQSSTIRKLNNRSFPEQKELTKDDYVIVCGDFGMVWSNSAEELYWRKWLDKKPFTTLFVDGNHENFDILNSFPVEEWNGGKVHRISDTVIHLMRGQVFAIDGTKFFTMGGAPSIDKMYRKEGRSWWAQEIPSEAELLEGMDNLEAHNWAVDYVLTHTTSRRLMNEMGYLKEQATLNSYFDNLEKSLDYKHWFFGHFHDDVCFDKHTLVYNKIVEVS